MKLPLIPVAGLAIYIPNDDGIEHLTAVIAAVADSGDVALVSITTDHGTRLTDRACVLDVGDHSFLRHRSFALYADSWISSVEALQAGVDRREIRLAETFSAEVLERLARGAIDSPRTPRGPRDLVRKCWPALESR